MSSFYPSRTRSEKNKTDRSSSFYTNSLKKKCPSGHFWIEVTITNVQYGMIKPERKSHFLFSILKRETLGLTKIFFLSSSLVRFFHAVVVSCCHPSLFSSASLLSHWYLFYCCCQVAVALIETKESSETGQRRRSKRKRRKRERSVRWDGKYKGYFAGGVGEFIDNTRPRTRERRMWRKKEKKEKLYKKGAEVTTATTKSE